MASARLKRLTRFGLKSLLVLTAIVAVWCGYYASHARWRGQALALIATRGGLTWQRPAAGATDDSFLGRLGRRYDETVYRLFGETLRPNVTAVEVTDAFLSAKNLETLAALSEIEWLSMSGSTIDNASVVHLAEFEQLRWLDLSRSNVSAAGVRQLSRLQRLEWLDVSNTEVKRKDIERLQAVFSNTRIGFEFEPSLYAAEESGVDRDSDTTESNRALADSSQAVSLWQAYRRNPYVKDQLVDYLDAIGQSQTVGHLKWYISGVYEAERRDQDPLLIVQIESYVRLILLPDGLPNVFRRGTILAFDSGGDLLRTMPGECFRFSLQSPREQKDGIHPQSEARDLRKQKVARGETLDLPDLNGDGYDEILANNSTARFEGETRSNLLSDARAIYTTSIDDVPCVLRIGVPRAAKRGTLIDLTGMNPLLVYRDVGERSLYLETPCYAAVKGGWSLLEELPRRRLAAFVWSDDAGTFLGPANGPQDAWIVLPPAGDEGQ